MGGVQLKITAMTMQSTSLWDFSNQLYDREGIASVCLDLQDDYRLDVNLLLFCCWCAHFEKELPEEIWQRILGFSNEWRSQVVKPLRDVRKWMKLESSPYSRETQFSVLRDRIKMDELAAEKIQQEFIESSLQNLVKTKVEYSEARANSYLTRLLQAFKIERGKEINAQLEVLIKAANDSAGGE